MKKYTTTYPPFVTSTHLNKPVLYCNIVRRHSAGSGPIRKCHVSALERRFQNFRLQRPGQGPDHILLNFVDIDYKTISDSGW